MSPTKATKKPTASAGASASGSTERKSPGFKEAANSGASEAARPDSNVPGASSAAAVLPTPPTTPPDEASDGKDLKKDKAPSAVQTLALELSASNDSQAVLRHAIALEDDREATANQAARLIQELSEIKPELLVPLIERFSRLLVSKNKRVVASSATALAPLSRIAPAKVAKQLPLLTQNWEHTTDEGKDGLVRTFAGLCTASVAYQKRLEPALARALGEAEPKLLIRWTEIVLPALKGEPHARARAVVEERLPNIPRPQAQKIADFLGIKLRPLMR
jgi:hypothetical protein